MSSERCNDSVYRHGEHVGVFAWSKAEAEAYRKRATNSKWLYDWHFAAGRVVMMRIRRGIFPAIGRLLRRVGSTLGARS
jgi:hypothetical protein